MRITRIETITVGAGWKNWLFARVHTDEGLTGIGEGTLNGFVRTIEAAIHELEHLAVGEDPTCPTAIAKRLVESVSNDGGHLHKHAVAAIETACWDILGKSVGLPLHALVGGRVRDSVLGYANGWYRTERTPEAFEAAAEQVVEKGFKALKVDPFGTAQGFIGEQELGVAVDIVSELRPALPRGRSPDRRPRALRGGRSDSRRARLRAPRRCTGGKSRRRASAKSRHRLSRARRRCGSRPARRSTCRASSSRSPRRAACRSGSPSRCRSAAFGAALAVATPRRRGRRVDRTPSKRRSGGDGALPAARRLRPQLPDPGALRPVQRSVDVRPRDLAPADRCRQPDIWRSRRSRGSASTWSTRSRRRTRTTRTRT